MEKKSRERNFLLPSLPTSHSQFEFIHHIRTKPEKLRLRLIEWKHRLGVTLPSLYFNPRTSILPSRIWSSSQHPFTPGYLWNLRAFVRIRGKSRSNFCPHRQAGFNFLRFPFAFSNRASFPSGPPFSPPFFFSPLLEKKNSRKRGRKKRILERVESWLGLWNWSRGTRSQPLSAPVLWTFKGLRGTERKSRGEGQLYTSGDIYIYIFSYLVARVFFLQGFRLPR